MPNTTPESTEIVSTRTYNLASNDELLTHICLDLTIGDVIDRCERCRGPRGFALYKFVRDAVIEFDIEKLERIISRIDGGVPEEGQLDQAANYIGAALNDVMDYDDIDDVRALLPTDPPIISMAKALYILAVRDCGTNTQMRKDSARAMDIILTRTGGRRVKPVRERIENKYEDPDWMKGALPNA